MCVLVVLSIVLVQASSAPQSSISEDAAQPANEELSAIPLLMLMLPFAAVAAYVLEWTNRKT
jgi:hypothetical protein